MSFKSCKKDKEELQAKITMILILYWSIVTFISDPVLINLFCCTGCIRSSLQHTGSSLHHVGSFHCSTHSSCGMQAHQLWHSCSVACRILVSQPRIEPMSPALQGTFLTTGPQQSPYQWSLFLHMALSYCWVFLCFRLKDSL